jgi:hypothetical protein
MPGFIAQQSQHGLVAAVNAIKIANGDSAGRCQFGVVNTAKDLHGLDWLEKVVS